VLVPHVPTDNEREAVAHESRRRQQQARHDARAVDAAAHAAHEDAKREQLTRELPEHLRTAV
jgi:hypothetical protein